MWKSVPRYVQFNAGRRKSRIHNLLKRPMNSIFRLQRGSRLGTDGSGNFLNLLFNFPRSSISQSETWSEAHTKRCLVFLQSLHSISYIFNSSSSVLPSTSLQNLLDRPRHLSKSYEPRVRISTRPPRLGRGLRYPP